MRTIAPLLAIAALATAADDGFVPRTFTGAQGSLNYQLLAPAVMNRSTLYPLVLVLHGAGERGDNNTAQLKHGSKLFLDAGNRARFPAFVVFPQCPNKARWVEVDWGQPTPHQQPAQPSVPMSLVLELMPELQKSLPIDNTRIYVMGLSMGGFGTWDLLARRPAWFAAAVPICGGADDRTASTLARIPIWTFHGDKDTTVKTARTRSMVEALKAAGSPVKYTELPGVGHDAWSPAFAQPELLPWLFAQKRG